MRDDGVQRAAAIVTSAYSSYSGCRQYRENLAAAVAEVPGAPRVDKLRHYFNHPGFVEPMVDATLSRAGRAPRGGPPRRAPRLRHPLDPGRDGRHQRSRRGRLHRAAPPGRWRRSSPGSARRPGTATPPSWCSARARARRTCPWLEPDVNDHLRELRSRGVPGAVVVPIGFVSDHMEVIYDLDTEAAATAEEIGLPFARAATAGVDPRFVAMVRDLLLERAAASATSRVERARSGGPRVVGRLPGRLLPQPAGPAPRAVRAGLNVCHRRGRPAATRPGAAATWPSRSPARRRRSRCGCATRASRSPRPSPATSTSSPGPTGPARSCSASGILAARPDDGVVGEEGDDVVRQLGVRWVVDPIDGTVNYLYGLPHCAVSVAAARRSTASSRSWPGPSWPPRSAGSTPRSRGGGAWRDGSAAAGPRASRAPEKSLVATGFSYCREVRARQGRAVAASCWRGSATSGAGRSCALDLCALAAGALDAYVEEGPSWWDHAAGGLVAEEAGRRRRGLGGARAGPRGGGARVDVRRLRAAGGRVRVPGPDTLTGGPSASAPGPGRPGRSPGPGTA